MENTTTLADYLFSDGFSDPLQYILKYLTECERRSLSMVCRTATKTRRYQYDGHVVTQWEHMKLTDADKVDSIPIFITYEEHAPHSTLCCDLRSMQRCTILYARKRKCSKLLIINKKIDNERESWLYTLSKIPHTFPVEFHYDTKTMDDSCHLDECFHIYCDRNIHPERVAKWHRKTNSCILRSNDRYNTERVKHLDIPVWVNIFNPVRKCHGSYMGNSKTIKDARNNYAASIVNKQFEIMTGITSESSYVVSDEEQSLDTDDSLTEMEDVQKEYYLQSTTHTPVSGIVYHWQMEAIDSQHTSVYGTLRNNSIKHNNKGIYVCKVDGYSIYQFQNMDYGCVVNMYPYDRYRPTLIHPEIYRDFCRDNNYKDDYRCLYLHSRFSKIVCNDYERVAICASKLDVNKRIKWLKSKGMLTTYSEGDFRKILSC